MVFYRSGVRLPPQCHCLGPVGKVIGRAAQTASRMQKAFDDVGVPHRLIRDKPVLTVRAVQASLAFWSCRDCTSCMAAFCWRRI